MEKRKNGITAVTLVFLTPFWPLIRCPYTFRNYKNNMKKTWRIINETLGKTNQKNNLPMFIEHNNTLITDPNTISNTFNDYFANIGSDLASNICADGNNEMYKQYLLTQSQCTCKFEKIHEDDILKIINKMDNKSSSGYDMFSNKIIKAIKNEISKHTHTLSRNIRKN